MSTTMNVEMALNVVYGNLWNTTVQRTPENLANDKDIGIFFPRSGTIADSSGCTLKYEEFYVGTKAYLLSGYAEKDTNQFLRNIAAAVSDDISQRKTLGRSEMPKPVRLCNLLIPKAWLPKNHGFQPPLRYARAP